MPLAFFIFAGCDVKSENAEAPVAAKQIINPNDQYWSIESKSCDGVPLTMLGSERIRLSDGAFIHGYVTKVTLTDICIDTDAYYRVIEKYDANTEIYNETSSLMSEKKRIICYNQNTGDKLSEQTVDVPFQTHKLLVNVNQDAGTISLYNTSQCNGLLTYSVKLSP